MSKIILIRPITPNRPKKHRISTPSGWVNITRKTVDGVRVEVAEVPAGESGKARALVVAAGFSIHEAPPAPEPEPESTGDGEAGKGEDVKPPAPVDPDSLLVLLDGTVDEFDAKLDDLEAGENTLPEADRLQLIIAERAGKNRKGILRRLGVEVD